MPGDTNFMHRRADSVESARGLRRCALTHPSTLQTSRRTVKRWSRWRAFVPVNFRMYGSYRQRLPSTYRLACGCIERRSLPINDRSRFAAHNDVTMTGPDDAGPGGELDGRKNLTVRLHSVLLLLTLAGAGRMPGAARPTHSSSALFLMLIVVAVNWQPVGCGTITFKQKASAKD